MSLSPSLWGRTASTNDTNWINYILPPWWGVPSLLVRMSACYITAVRRSVKANILVLGTGSTSHTTVFILFTLDKIILGWRSLTLLSAEVSDSENIVLVIDFLLWGFIERLCQQMNHPTHLRAFSNNNKLLMEAGMHAQGFNVCRQLEMLCVWV